MLVKFVETSLSNEERGKLRKTSFGLPEERKFPLNDASHVRNAIARFKYCPADKKGQLARRIRKAAEKFGVVIADDSPITNYEKV